MVRFDKYIENLSGLEKIRVKTIKMSADDGNLTELVNEMK